MTRPLPWNSSAKKNYEKTLRESPEFQYQKGDPLRKNRTKNPQVRNSVKSSKSSPVASVLGVSRETFSFENRDFTKKDTSLMVEGDEQYRLVEDELLDIAHELTINKQYMISDNNLEMKLAQGNYDVETAIDELIADQARLKSATHFQHSERNSKSAGAKKPTGSCNNICLDLEVNANKELSKHQKGPKQRDVKTLVDEPADSLDIVLPVSCTSNCIHHHISRNKQIISSPLIRAKNDRANMSTEEDELAKEADLSSSSKRMRRIRSSPVMPKRKRDYFALLFGNDTS
ncbi:hypothetical protein V1511DRAFT_513250 [Dipodascopsis uninucleata]